MSTWYLSIQAAERQITSLLVSELRPVFQVLFCLRFISIPKLGHLLSNGRSTWGKIKLFYIFCVGGVWRQGQEDI